MAKRDWEITITGLDEVEQLMAKLPDKLESNLYIGFERYVKKHLVTRMKERLSKASQPMQASHMDPNTGVPSGGGGYGTERNGTAYAEWKSSRDNLPQVGQLSTRELVATGHLVDSIDVTQASKGSGVFSFSVGAKPGERPSVQPFVDADGYPGTRQADLSRRIENTQLMEWIEDSKYAFLAKEYEDVLRDIEPLVLHLLKMTLLQLAKEIVSKK